jgi:hypothetical protein
MNISNLKKHDIMPKKIEIMEAFNHKLNMSLCVPSVSSSYSMCINYMRAWIKNKFDSKYFKSEFVSGRNILYDFINKDKNTILHIVKPALSINPKLDTDYNRDDVDSYQAGLNLYLNKLRYTDSFFKDTENDRYIAFCPELLKINFSFRIKVSSKAHAIDLLKFLKMAVRSGGVITDSIDLDFHVPTELMYRVAKDAGFELDDKGVSSPELFIQYLNKNSALAFMYKYRSIKGIFEYFIRVPNCYIRIKNENVTMDDGDRDGQLDNNFIVEFESECLFTSPQFYAYYSAERKDYVKEFENNGTYNIYELCLCDIPVLNDKGWNQYITSDYIDDDENYDSSKPTIIDFKELITSTVSKGGLYEKCEYLKQSYLNPSLFIDIKLYNDNKEQQITIDWANYVITSINPLPSKSSHIVFYVDLNYSNEYYINRYNTKEDKM